MRTFLFLLIATAIAPPIFAANLVANPSFAQDLSGWFTLYTSFDAADNAPDSVGGSARSTVVSSTVSFPPGGAETTLALSQCISTGEGTYVFGGKVLIPSGQTKDGSGSIVLTFYSGPDCVTGVLGTTSMITSTTGSWETLSDQHIAPGGTTHIGITARNNVPLDSTPPGRHVVIFDDFFLDNVGPAVPALGPFGLLALFATIATIGLFALQR